MKNIAVIILAAGSSSRLGQPKQLVSFGQKTLLQHALDVGSSFGFCSKLLVLGAKHSEIGHAVSTAGFKIIHNADWQEGIGSSIRAGMEHLLKTPDVEHVLFLLADQPFVSEKLIETLLKSHKNEITACSYKGQVGVPAIFSRNYFSYLTSLSGDKGAKRVIKSHLSDTTIVDFEMGYFDIDTRVDLEKLEALYQKRT